MPSKTPSYGLQLHLEPDNPIEISELTGALSGLARQYDVFAKEIELYPPTERARLLVSSVSPGSIDINFITETAAVLAPVLSGLETATAFAKHLKDLFGLFSGEKDPPKEGITVKDCDDVIAINKPVANNGGSQTFNTFQGPVINHIFQVNAPEAMRIIANASNCRSALQLPNADRRERVSMIWKRLDKDQVRTKGSTPDKGLIEDIDPRPRAVHFTDNMTFLKREMMQDTENPYLYVYYVDVEVSRVSGLVIAYRVVGYHGKEGLDANEHPDILF